MPTSDLYLHVEKMAEKYNRKWEKTSNKPADTTPEKLKLSQKNTTRTEKFKTEVKISVDDFFASVVESLENGKASDVNIQAPETIEAPDAFTREALTAVQTALTRTETVLNDTDLSTPAKTMLLKQIRDELSSQLTTIN